ncbi:MAG: hypothetical protein L0J48_04085 [Alkalibacterium sp.]|uniref:Multicomponent Na+:H+ antiporter subunit B n=1 Tax=Alkalibacterium gilvum TaxID=1130080 RepID=A0A1H6SW46_9LACT|nr:MULTISPECIES: MnhB domain-containing protein [Alkalibacterium]MDN6194454.1 hypothetical protein [Alkalibacterium sp.]MDN6293941.1 hypothetical protein [Alkalibacterium sp.]MDN6295565.1 hypothetical protein [Alkalibacterium sp.]MDN6327192.1 hypothetical protein [Alkalibacterium sp.]MDN6398694.1 hypothetical protein [Alkalibacterium sp.]
MKETNRSINIIRVIFMVVSVFIVLFFFLNYSEKMSRPLMDYFTAGFLAETGAQNAVAAIYLDYRVFDTLLEALMLLVSVMEVINVSWAHKEAKQYSLEEELFNRKDNSEIVIRMVGAIYPFVLLIGLYTIFNGHISPGGGFQGGVILATALISRYLVYPNSDLDLEKLENFEKLLFLAIVAIPVLYIFMQVEPFYSLISRQFYMILMNSLIGLKVFSGLSIIFYRFVFYEGR